VCSGFVLDLLILEISGRGVMLSLDFGSEESFPFLRPVKHWFESCMLSWANDLMVRSHFSLRGLAPKRDPQSLPGKNSQGLAVFHREVVRSL